MNQYVLVIESTDPATDERGVDAVIGHPGGGPWVHGPAAATAKEMIQAQLDDDPDLLEATVTVVDLDRWTAPPGRARVVCPDCGQSTWREGFGCELPGCENHGVLVGQSEPTRAIVESVYPPTSELWASQEERP